MKECVQFEDTESTFYQKVAQMCSVQKAEMG